MPEEPQPQIFGSLKLSNSSFPPAHVPNQPPRTSNDYARQPTAGRESALEPSHRRSHFHHSIHSSSRPSLHLRNLDRPRRRAEPHMAPSSPDLFRRSFR